MKPVYRSKLADQDIENAIGYYVENAPTALSSLIDDLEQAYAHIQRRPATGSPRYAHELDIPGLRFWPCKRHPYLIFYMEYDEQIKVWRVLHVRNDIPNWLQDSSA